MQENDEFIEVVANDIDKIDISDKDINDVDDKVTPTVTSDDNKDVDNKVTPTVNPDDNKIGDFLDIYKRVRDFYGDTIGLTTPGALPRVEDIKNIYEGTNIDKDMLIKRRWAVASELAILDIMVRDMVAIQKYLNCTVDQQFLTRAVDHFTKDDCDEKWDIKRWAFVIVHKDDVDKYDLGKTAIYEDEIFHYRFCKDFTFAELFVSKFPDDDLRRVLLAPLNANAFGDT